MLIQNLGKTPSSLNAGTRRCEDPAPLECSSLASSFIPQFPIFHAPRHLTPILLHPDNRNRIPMLTATKNEILQCTTLELWHSKILALRKAYCENTSKYIQMSKNVAYDLESCNAQAGEAGDRLHMNPKVSKVDMWLQTNSAPLRPHLH